MGNSPWSCKQSDMTEQLTLSLTSFIQLISIKGLLCPYYTVLESGTEGPCPTRELRTSEGSALSHCFHSIIATSNAKYYENEVLLEELVESAVVTGCVLRNGY